MALVGCGEINENLAITSKPESCQAVSDVHFFTAVAGLICWDKNGNPVQPANSSVSVVAPANMASSIINTAVPVAGAAFMGPTNSNKTTVNVK